MLKDISAEEEPRISWDDISQKQKWSRGRPQKDFPQQQRGSEGYAKTRFNSHQDEFKLVGWMVVAS